MPTSDQSEPVLRIPRRVRPTVLSVLSVLAATPPEKTRTIAESIALYHAIPEDVKRSIKRGYELLIDSGVKVEFEI